jgi:hypothetical protein
VRFDQSRRVVDELRTAVLERCANVSRCLDQPTEEEYQQPAVGEGRPLASALKIGGQIAGVKKS